MNRRRRAGIIAALLAVGAVPSTTGCTLTCTLIGCWTGLMVTVTGAEPAEYTLRIEAPGADPVILECSPPANCSGLPFLEGTHPEVEVVVLDAGGVELARETFFPDYERSRPNGRGCPPTCWSAEAVVTL
jgi:hypothetical protein